MPIYDYVWLCMMMYDYVWLCMTLYENIFPQSMKIFYTIFKTCFYPVWSFFYDMHKGTFTKCLNAYSHCVWKNVKISLGRADPSSGKLELTCAGFDLGA